MATRSSRKTNTQTDRETRTDRQTVVAVFHSQAEAQKAVRDLKAARFTDQEIGIAAKDHDGSFQDQTEGSKAGEGAAVGAVSGLGAGALWGLGIVAGVLPAYSGIRQQKTDSFETERIMNPTVLITGGLSAEAFFNCVAGSCDC